MKIQLICLAALLSLLATACAPASSSQSGGLSLPSSSDSNLASETFQFYAVNDFHGAVLENDEDYYESGLLKYGGYLKSLKQKDPEHTILVSAGDMWQGSLESNDSTGKLVTAAMNDIGFDAMALGNHEFDFGQDVIAENAELANFPFLAGNIVKFENGAPTSTAWEGAKASTIIEKGSTKIGIVGMIGEGETTSIMSKYVSDLYFTSTETPSITEAKRLREQEDCDIVILAVHADSSSILYDSSYTTSWTCKNNLKDYFDGVFTAHSHTKNLEMIDGVPLIQSYCNGEAISHFAITISSTGAICTKYEIITADASWAEDTSLKTIEDTYIGTEAFKTKANGTCGTLVGNLTRGGVGNLGCKAIYERVIGDYPEVAVTIMNSQRATLAMGTVTYSAIYKSTPFLNHIVIMKIPGSEIYSSSGNCTYTGDLSSYSDLNSSTIYTVAVIDYLAYHQNVNKYYNYFPSLNANPDNVIATISETPHDLIFSYLKTLGGTYSSSSFADEHYNIYK